MAAKIKCTTSLYPVNDKNYTVYKVYNDLIQRKDSYKP